VCDQTYLTGLSQCFDAALGIQFLVNILQMGFDGLFTQNGVTKESIQVHYNKM